MVNRGIASREGWVPSGRSRIGNPLAEMRRGGGTLLSCVVGCAVGLLGLSVYGLPFLAGPIAKELGVEPTDIPVAGSFLVAGLMLTGPLAGRLADRLNPRPMILASIIGFSLGLLAVARLVGTIYQFYAIYFLLAVFGAGTTFAIYAKVVNGLFDRSRGMALGFMMSGPGISAAVLPAILPTVIAAHGWRGGYVALGMLALCAFPIALVAIPRRPLLAVDAPTASKPGNDAGSLSLSEAVATYRFWGMAIGTILVSSTIIATHLNMVNLLRQRGFLGSSVVAFASMFGIGSVAGRIVVGLILDRVRGTFVGGALFLCTAIGMVVFASSTTWSFIIAGAGVLGISSGAEGDLTAYLVSRYFGTRSFSEIYSWMYSAIAAGLVVGPPIASLVVKQTGGFEPWLWGSACACLAAAGLFLSLGRYPPLAKNAEAAVGD